MRQVVERCLDVLLRNRSWPGSSSRDPAGVVAAADSLWDDMLDLGQRLNTWLAGPSATVAEQLRAVAAMEVLGAVLTSATYLHGVEVSETELRDGAARGGDGRAAARRLNPGRPVCVSLGDPAPQRRTSVMIRRVGVLLAALLVLSPAAAAASPVFPSTVDLPAGFQPEGIAIGPGPVAYLGSLADGSIYRVDLITGRGRVVSEGPGTPSVGMKTDHRGRLYVAGGAAGNARVIDTRTGRVLASHQLATGAAFVNDVVARGGLGVVHRLGEPGALPAHTATRGHRAADR